MKPAELRKHVHIRPGCTSDAYVCGEVVREYRELQLQDKIVFDLGANIGAFSVYADLMGARSVVGYEPDDDNFKMYLTNTGSRASCIQHFGAITKDKRPGTTSFYLTNGLAKDGYSIIPFKGRTEICVPTFSLQQELRFWHPSVIKMDIEGAEWDILLDEPLPDHVKEIVVELHFNKKEFRPLLDKVKERFSEWTVIKDPKDTGKSFHTLGHWRR